MCTILRSTTFDVSEKQIPHVIHSLHICMSWPFGDFYISPMCFILKSHSYIIQSNRKVAFYNILSGCAIGSLNCMNGWTQCVLHKIYRCIMGGDNQI